MRILVVGASGLLGSNVVTAGKSCGFDIFGTYYSVAPHFEIPLEQLDIRNINKFRKLVQKYQPRVVVNCAAMTDVDKCESDPDHAFAINAEAPKQLVTVCEELGIRFVHISTDYVFDGTASSLYSEGDDPNPQQVYGKSKLTGEKAVCTIGSESLVIRPSFVYGVHQSRHGLTGFPAWILAQFENDRSIPLFTDQQITPSRAGGIAETLVELMQKDISGIIHLASQSCVTPYEFGERICKLIGKPTELLVEGSMEDVDRQAERPKQTCLDIGHVEQLLGRRQPTLDEDLAAIDSYFN